MKSTLCSWAFLLALSTIPMLGEEDKGTVRSSTHAAPAVAATPPATPPPADPPPPPPATKPAPPESAPPDQQKPAPTGQWVYTEQYGWVWMPYGKDYTHLPKDGGTPSMYVYYPETAAWCWVTAPWLWGWGPSPYFGVYGAGYYGWYGVGLGLWCGFAAPYYHYGWNHCAYYGGGTWHGVSSPGGYGSRDLGAPWTRSISRGAVGGSGSYRATRNSRGAESHGAFSGSRSGASFRSGGSLPAGSGTRSGSMVNGGSRGGGSVSTGGRGGGGISMGGGARGGGSGGRR